jgi:signal transduction histidine kinase/ligand-binding sensor domain-containing protein
MPLPVTGRCLPVGRMRLRGAVCALVYALFVGSQLPALDPAQAITQYAHSTWSREAARLPGGVSSFAQTPDGELWIGTDSGLLQFDGARFLRWSPPAGQQLASEHILALAPGRDGSLWIGTREGISHWKDARVRNYQTSKGPEGPSVVAILIDRAGTAWVGTAGYRSGGLCRLENDTLRCDPPGAPPQFVLSLLEDRQGGLWAGGRGLSNWKPGPPRIYPPAGSTDQIYAIAEDRQGRIWAAGSGLTQIADSRLAPIRIFPRNQKTLIKALLSDRDGGLWIGTLGQGLMRVYNGRIDRFNQVDGLSGDNVFSLLEDHEGNIWVGTDGGLDRFRENAVTTISTREGLSHSAGASVFAAKDGGVWIGTGNGLNRFTDGRVIAYDNRQGLPSKGIFGIFQEHAAGRLWVLTGAGLNYSDGGRFRLLHLPSGQKIRFTAAAEDRDHSVWLSDPDHGLIRLRDTRVAETIPWSKLANKQAWALESDRNDGGLWLGFAQGGIAHYASGQALRSYSMPGRLGRAAVTDLHQSPDGSLWIATQAGLGVLRNQKFTAMTAANGLPCEGIRAMVEDDAGALWLDTNCGLVSIPPNDLRKWSNSTGTRLQPRVYDSSDGLRRGLATLGYFRRATKSSDGRLWFALFDGVAVVNPKRLPENRLPPPVKIEEITAGPTGYSVHPNLRLPPLTRELRIDYAAMSFVAPEKVRFRYRLEGFDNDWKDDAGGRQAVYTNLPPRHYRFRVIACNNDGVWNNAGAACDFWIEPAFHQTRWFQLLCLCAFALLVWTGYRFRIRQMSRRLILEFQTRLDERTRISREMHDTLLQNICGFALQLDGLSKASTIPAAARERLREIRREAEDCLREAREFVWDLRAPVLQEVDLSEILRGASEQITLGAPVSFHFTVEGSPHPAPPELRQQLCRIVQEATRNAVRYSHAKEIEMHIAYLDPGRIRVQMRDDGCGFDPEKAYRESGHWGLKTMRERAQQIGAELRISSAPGHGTEVEIVVPTSAA